MFFQAVTNLGCWLRRYLKSGYRSFPWERRSSLSTVPLSLRGWYWGRTVQYRKNVLVCLSSGSVRGNNWDWITLTPVSSSNSLTPVFEGLSSPSPLPPGSFHFGLGCFSSFTNGMPRYVLVGSGIRTNTAVAFPLSPGWYISGCLVC